MATLPQPVKLWYSRGECSATTAVQRGRLREFGQFDVEAIGSDDPAVDAEIIALAGCLVRRASAWTASSSSSTRSATPRGRGAPTWRCCVAYLDAHRERALGGRAARARHQPAARLRHQGRGRPRDLADGARRSPTTSRPRRAEHFAARARLPRRARRRLPRRRRRSCAASTTTRAPRGRSSGRQLGAQSDDLRRRALRRPRREIGGAADARASASAAGIERIVLALEARPAPSRRSPRVRLVRACTTTRRGRALHALLDELRARGPALPGRPGGAQPQGPVRHAERAGRAAAWSSRAATSGRPVARPAPGPTTRRHRAMSWTTSCGACERSA